MNRLNIRQCKIPIASREEFINVSRICLDSGLTWFDDDDSYDSIDRSNKVLIVCCLGDQILYDTDNGHNNKEEVSYKEFINDYDTTKYMKIEPNKVIINSEEEFNNVARICLNNGYKWGDRDSTYNSIHGDHKAILVENNSDKEILYITNTGFSEYEDISYTSFMNRYNSINKSKPITKLNKTTPMRIEQCRVMVTSKEQFDTVSRICLANGVKWYHPEEDKYNTVCGDIRVLLVDDDYELLFIDYFPHRGDHISFQTFMDKYDKGITDKVMTLITKLNDTLFKKKRPTLKQTM